jgi:hypothetical protein
MKALKSFIRFVSPLLIFIFAACGNGGSDSGGGGSLSLELTDAATYQYDAVYVTIEEVLVHIGGDENEGSNWEVVASLGKTYNLLDLRNGVREELGISLLQPGHYTQMRLIIGEVPDDGINILSESHPHANYIILNSDTYHELKVPSGLQTGIKIIHGFDITANQTTELILDFDASKSIVMAGASGKWLLKPTIKVLNTEDYSIIRGAVTTVIDDELSPLKEVLVSAQIVNDGVIVQASTVTDEEGSYMILLQPNTYYIVAYKGSTEEDPNIYNPGCATIKAEAGFDFTKDFTLTKAELTGNLTGSVSITGGDGEQHAIISFRQGLQCEEVEQMEVTSLNVAKGGTYSIILPQGTYTVVASTFGRDNEEYDDVQVIGGDTELIIEF